MPTIFKVYLQSEGGIFTCDAVSYKDKLWIITSWLDNLDKEFSQPELMFRFDNLSNQKMNDSSEYDYIINDPIDKKILQGMDTGNYEVIKKPPLFFPCRGKGPIH